MKSVVTFINISFMYITQTRLFKHDNYASDDIKNINQAFRKFLSDINAQKFKMTNNKKKIYKQDSFDCNKIQVFLVALTNDVKIQFL